MGLKDQFDKVVDKGKDAVENVKDAVKEAAHRSTAEAEQTKRDVAGDEMTTTQKIGSFVNQKKNEVEANTDAAKRDVRNNT